MLVYLQYRCCDIFIHYLSHHVSEEYPGTFVRVSGFSLKVCLSFLLLKANTHLNG